MSTAQNTLKLEAQTRTDWTGTDHATSPDHLKIDVFSSPRPIRADWIGLEPDTKLPFVTYAWAEAWFGSVCTAQGQQPYIVVGRDLDGAVQFILPFLLERRGPFRVLKWPGSGHCSYQCGLFSRALRNRLWTVGCNAFWQNVLGNLKGVDAIAAYGLPELADEQDNPMHALPWLDTGCSGRSFKLDGDWQALHEAKCNAKIRRNERRCERRLAELGEVRFRIGRTTEQKLKLIDTLLDQKSAQLHAEGLPDFTSEPGVRSFYRRLAKSPHWPEGSEFFIASLELDGLPVAVNLGLVNGTVLHGLILSMAEGNAARFGPGQLLLRQTFEHYCGSDVETIDMGVGDGAWKEKWGDQLVGRRDVIVPLTLRGRLFSTSLRAMFRVKSKIKNTPALWRLFSRYRRLLHC